MSAMSSIGFPFRSPAKMTAALAGLNCFPSSDTMPTFSKTQRMKHYDVMNKMVNKKKEHFILYMADGTIGVSSTDMALDTTVVSRNICSSPRIKVHQNGRRNESSPDKSWGIQDSNSCRWDARAATSVFRSCSGFRGCGGVVLLNKREDCGRRSLRPLDPLFGSGRSPLEDDDRGIKIGVEDSLLFCNRHVTIAALPLSAWDIGYTWAKACEEELKKTNDTGHYEYIQIFRSIPVLFEYLLNVIEERPQILENNDVTMFKRNLDGEHEEDIESYDERDRDKRENNDEKENVNKRETDDSKAVRTTAAYEYGNSNVVMKGLDENEESKVIAKRYFDNNNFDDHAVDGLFKRKVVFKLDDDTRDMFHKYGKVFLGFEHMFGLDLKPEDIEDCIIATDNLLEEYNSKKDWYRDNESPVQWEHLQWCIGHFIQTQMLVEYLQLRQQTIVVSSRMTQHLTDQVAEFCKNLTENEELIVIAKVFKQIRGNKPTDVSDDMVRGDDQMQEKTQQHGNQDCPVAIIDMTHHVAEGTVQQAEATDHDR
uniref:SFRICE_014339 n=1 Tax=Spodoptera frugiperda TaxID=7108 RepID=A0A2H1VB38_SPOFR